MNILQLLQADLFWFSPRHQLRCSIHRLNNDIDFMTIWTFFDAGEVSPGAIKEHQMHTRTTYRPNQRGIERYRANITKARTKAR